MATEAAALVLGANCCNITSAERKGVGWGEVQNHDIAYGPPWPPRAKKPGCAEGQSRNDTRGPIVGKLHGSQHACRKIWGLTEKTGGKTPSGNI